ncbi:hypothetical protein CC80DRAFT_550343 [Byssothecium circinans]|uniref:RING-type domain-containing protein n=1 Tax=Byssothecium circinans TaxID=147558 RepID=A0A6A5TPF6_9PLEO|nr:hypothetical protein CC80DRAFT_550343 [Byssothecium circinans]
MPRLTALTNNMLRQKAPTNNVPRQRAPTNNTPRRKEPGNNMPLQKAQVSEPTTEYTPTWRQSIAHLDRKFSKVKAEMDRIKAAEAKALRNNVREDPTLKVARLQHFDKMMQQFWDDYSRTMRLNLEERGSGMDILEYGLKHCSPLAGRKRDFHKVWKYHRWVQYELAPQSQILGMQWFSLHNEPYYPVLFPFNICTSYTPTRATAPWDIVQERIMMAECIAFLGIRRHVGARTDVEYITTVLGHFQGRRQLLLSALPPEAKWLVDFSITPPMELVHLMHLSRQLRRAMYDCESCEFDIDHCRSKNARVPHKIEDFTTDLTPEQATPPPDNICGICGFTFGLIHDVESGTEPAVRLDCQAGHVFGKVCLASWLQDHNTCPKCRDRLPERQFRPLPPGPPHPWEQQLDRFRSEMLTYDAEVDGYFLKPLRDIYDQEMEGTLHRLNIRLAEVLSLRESLRQLVDSLADRFADSSVDSLEDFEF